MRSKAQSLDNEVGRWILRRYLDGGVVETSKECPVILCLAFNCFKSIFVFERLMHDIFITFPGSTFHLLPV